MSESDIPVFNYVLGVRHRENIVTIFQGGMSQWDDLSQGSLLGRLRDEVTAPTVVEVRISYKIYDNACRMAEKERAEEMRTGQYQSPQGETADAIAQMDELLAEFFWTHVNPHLPKPLRSQ